MIERLLPIEINNTFGGSTFAFWLFGVIVLMKLVMGINVAGLNPWVSNRDLMQKADGIPIDSYSYEARETAVFLFSCWGLALMVLSLLGSVVMVRYRAMIPLMYLLLAIEQIGRRGLSLAHPAARSHAGKKRAAGGLVNWALSAALIVGLVLSLA